MPGIQHFLIDSVNSTHEITKLIDENLHLLDLGSLYINQKRAFKNISLKQGDYVRIHTQPRRYPVDKINWKETIIFEDDSLLVINKPYGIPVHSTVDNGIENVLVQMSKALNTPIFHTHRLDIGTQGVFILTKNPQAQTHINNLFRNKEIKKFYQARTETPLKPGHLIHYMQPAKRAPRVLSIDPLPGYKKCELIIHENEIELITGATHQIRCQLAFEGNPIIGDTLYGAKQTPPPDYIAEFFYLACVRMELPDGKCFKQPWKFAAPVAGAGDS